MLYLFTREWWSYILQPVDDDPWYWRFKTYLCRWRGHPYGVMFYNPSGFEPDMSCRNCGDDLG